jgi:hypothetical protein
MKYKTNILSQILVAVVLTTLIIGISSCEKNQFTPPKISTVDTVHFSTSIQPIFSANCVSCHTAIRNPDLRPGFSYSSLTKGGFVNLPGETSKLYLKITSSDHAARSSDADKQKILIWINQGAHNN